MDNSTKEYFKGLATGTLLPSGLAACFISPPAGLALITASAGLRLKHGKAEYDSFSHGWLNGSVGATILGAIGVVAASYPLEAAGAAAGIASAALIEACMKILTKGKKGEITGNTQAKVMGATLVAGGAATLISPPVGIGLIATSLTQKFILGNANVNNHYYNNKGWYDGVKIACVAGCAAVAAELGAARYPHETLAIMGSASIVAAPTLLKKSKVFIDAIKKEFASRQNA